MSQSGPEVIAAFDFDGTITVRDSLFHFLGFVTTPWTAARAWLVLLPTFVRYGLGLHTADVAKAKVLAEFLRGMDIAQFENKCRQYVSTRLPRILRQEALAKIDWHRRSGHTLVILSASPENWIAPWALQHGFQEVIATKLEVVDGKLTGNLRGKNCNDKEKVVRFLELYPDRKSYKMYAYGNSRHDLPFLNLADHPFFRSFYPGANRKNR